MRAMKDSGIEWIGQIPQEWDTSRTKYVYQIVSGNGFKEHLQGVSEGDYPFYKVSDINGSGMNVSCAANYVSKAVVQEYHNYSQVVGISPGYYFLEVTIWK